MDIRMPGIDGVECTRLVKEKYPNIYTIVLTTFDDDEYIFGALKYGASGYLLKGISMKNLAEAIRTVVSGKAMINPDITDKVVKLFNHMAQGSYSIQVDNALTEELTKTEWRGHPEKSAVECLIKRSHRNWHFLKGLSVTT